MTMTAFGTGGWVCTIISTPTGEVLLIERPQRVSGTTGCVFGSAPCYVAEGGGP